MHSVRRSILCVALGGLIVASVPTITAEALRRAEVAHSEQGDFYIIAPTVDRANAIAAECAAAGVTAERLDEKCVYIKITVDTRSWWDRARPRLTDCIVVAGAEGIPMRWVVSPGAEG